MKSLLQLKDFKKYELSRTTNLILTYNSYVSTKLLNYVSSMLVKHLVLLHGTFISKSIRFRENEVISFSKDIIWSDLNSQEIKKKKLTSNMVSFFYTKYVKVFLLYKLFTNFLFSEKAKVVSLPNERSIYTLLRSPHTDKKSREQFRKRVFKRAIHIAMRKSFLNFLIKKEYIASKVRSHSFLGN